MDNVNDLNIVIPTDLSSKSAEAIHNLIDSLEESVEITLFHCVEPAVSSGPIMIDVSDILISTAKEELQRIQSQLSSAFSDGNIIIRQHMCTGSFVYTFKEYVASELIDLVIIPSESKTTFELLFSGRKALSFVGELAVPTLVIPYSCSLPATIRTGLAIDQNEPHSKTVSTQLKQVSQALSMDIRPFHIDDFSENTLDYYLKQDLCTISDAPVQIVPAADISAGIQQWCKLNQIDLLAMVTHKKNFLERIFRHSTTKELINQNHIPVLVLTNPNE